MIVKGKSRCNDTVNKNFFKKVNPITRFKFFRIRFVFQLNSCRI